MVWNQVDQSNYAKTLATGEIQFLLSGSDLTAFLYPGQLLEIRSRANPNNRFVGNVIGYANSVLTFNVTGTYGSGTFSDWSVMSRFRIVVSPKTQGEHPGISLKSNSTALPISCRTAVEGYISTQAMFNGGDAALYPAAHWARGLSINGYSDWYIPARDELELCWRNLKPVVVNNYTATRSVSTGLYQTLGSYGDASVAQGVNLNSSPAGSGYTAATPTQTTSLLFRQGGSEAFTYGAERFWSSSEATATTVWFQHWHAEQPGNQSLYQSVQTTVRRIRAVRRSIV